MLDVQFQLSAFSVSAFRWSRPQPSTLNFSAVVIVCCCKELPRPTPRLRVIPNAFWVSTRAEIVF
jgi:hypothetical protein